MMHLHVAVVKDCDYRRDSETGDPVGAVQFVTATAAVFCPSCVEIKKNVRPRLKDANQQVTLTIEQLAFASFKVKRGKCLLQEGVCCGLQLPAKPGSLSFQKFKQLFSVDATTKVMHDIAWL